MMYRCFPDKKPICGNGVREEGEDCDALDLGGATCRSLGHAGGVLRCANDCTFNEKGCVDSLCGNGIVEAGEDCDGTSLGPGASCEAAGFGSGPVACYRNCTVDLSGCPDPPTCGNGVLDPGEQCDGTPLNPDCSSIGFPGGVLRCNENCTLDTSGCLRTFCGNGRAEEDLWTYEDCDGQDLRGQTCYDLGYPGGTLHCSEDCSLDTSLCDVPASCGNGVAEGAELCDGSDLGGVTCRDLGFSGGELRCTESCGYDLSRCDWSGPICGNGVLEEGEDCDGVVWRYESCEDLGYSGGTLGCNHCCCQFDTTLCECPEGYDWTETGCVEHGVVRKCGNGVLDAGEDCDGTNLAGATCESLGMGEGSLGCTPDCAYDVSGCGVPTGRAAAGKANTCFLDPTGRVWCVGDCSNGGVGNPDGCVMDRIGAHRPSLQDARPVVYVDRSYALIDGILGYTNDTGCGVHWDSGRQGFQIICWGVGDEGQLGFDPASELGDCAGGLRCSQVANEMPGGLLSQLRALTAGGRHFCILDGGGNVFCWGSNSWGQVGARVGEFTWRLSQVAGLPPVTVIGAGDLHSCAADTAGTVYCWGANDSGQLGVAPSQSPVENPVSGVAFHESVRSLCGGVNYTCALHGTGSVSCWGGNERGQLGQGTIEGGGPTPAQVSLRASATSVACGGTFACAVLTDGTAWCWGDNIRGQLGAGLTEESSPFPVQVMISEQVTFVAAGMEHACALGTGDQIWCWGANDRGQLGTGAVGTDSPTPLEVPHDFSQ